MRRVRVVDSHTGGEPTRVVIDGGPALAGSLCERVDVDSLNFVMCPGGAYDRSPCGTGISAKLACLQADGKLQEGEIWRQKSITGSVFEASYARAAGQIVPTIRGRAWVTAESTLLLDPDDPQCWGLVQP